MPWYNTPQATDSISATTAPIRNNFLAVEGWTLVDHVVITGGGPDEGKHNKVTLMQQAYVAGGNFAPAINLATGIGSVGIYAAQSTTNTGPSRMWAVIPRKTLPAWAIANIPFTESTILFTNPTSDIGGYTWLPSGILIQYGSMVVDLSGQLANVAVQAAPANFGIAFPTACFKIIVSPSLTTGTNSRAAICSAVILNLTQFQATASYTFTTNATGSVAFNYIAIGC